MGVWTAPLDWRGNTPNGMGLKGDTTLTEGPEAFILIMTDDDGIDYILTLTADDAVEYILTGV